MDGTLIDSGQDITASVNYVRSRVYGLNPLAVSEVVEAINRDQRNLAMLFYNRPTYEPEAQEIFEAHYLEQCVQSPTVYPGVMALLQGLAEAGVSLSVATNAPARFARRMLQHLELAELFNPIIGSESVQHVKPHPAMLNAVLEAHDYRPDSDFALMVGDSSKDMEAAGRAGIPGAFVTWGFSPKGEGDVVVSRPEELLDWMGLGRKGL